MVLRWLLIKENEVHIDAPEGDWALSGLRHRRLVQGSLQIRTGAGLFRERLHLQFDIGLTTIPPNFGRVWYPCFDNFVERATCTTTSPVPAGAQRIAKATSSVNECWPATPFSALRVTTPSQPTNPPSGGALCGLELRTHRSVQGCARAPHRQARAHRTHDHQIPELGFAIDALEYWWEPVRQERVGYVLTTDGALEIPTNIAYPQFMVGEGLVANGDLFAMNSDTIGGATSLRRASTTTCG